MQRLVMLTAVVLVAIVTESGAVVAQKPTDAECSLTGKGAFSIGWVEKQADQSFRCVAAFDASLKRVGTTWIRFDA